MEKYFILTVETKYGKWGGDNTVLETYEIPYTKEGRQLPLDKAHEVIKKYADCDYEVWAYADFYSYDEATGRKYKKDVFALNNKGFYKNYYFEGYKVYIDDSNNLKHKDMKRINDMDVNKKQIKEALENLKIEYDRKIWVDSSNNGKYKVRYYPRTHTFGIEDKYGVEDYENINSVVNYIYQDVKENGATVKIPDSARRHVRDNSNNDIVENFSPYLVDTPYFTGTGYNGVLIRDKNSDLKIWVDYWTVKDKNGMTTYDWEISPEWHINNSEKNWDAFEAVINDKTCMMAIENQLQKHLFDNDGVLDKIDPSDRRGNAYKDAKWRFEDVADSRRRMSGRSIVSRIKDSVKAKNIRRKITDAAEKYFNKDLKNLQAYRRVTDSKGKIKENVVFLIEDSDVLAVFPNTYGTASRDRDTMVCYSHNGQHGVCTYDYANTLKTADSKQYNELKDELENYVGYNLTILDSLPSETELKQNAREIRDAFKRYKRGQMITDERLLSRGEEIQYNGKRGTVQYALFHGKEPVVVRWQNDEGSEEFEVPYNEVSKLKIHDSDDDSDNDIDPNVEPVDNDSDIDDAEVTDNCGGKKKTKKKTADGVKRVKITKRQTKKTE